MAAFLKTYRLKINPYSLDLDRISGLLEKISKISFIYLKKLNDDKSILFYYNVSKFQVVIFYFFNRKN